MHPSDLFERFNAVAFDWLESALEALWRRVVVARRHFKENRVARTEHRAGMRMIDTFL